MKRKGMSKRLRFEIFKRDEFTCLYCGRKPPTVILQVDHVIAVCNGGTDEDTNLVTSCVDCNQGKGGAPLSAKPVALRDKRTQLMEREEQEREYMTFIRERRAREDRMIAELGELLYGKGWELQERNHAVARQFIRHFPYDELVDYAEIAFARTADRGDAWAYMCGICWRRMKGTQR